MKRPLRIGYVWQYEQSGLSPVSATALHIEAVVRGLQRRGHHVRVVCLRNGQPHYSDDGFAGPQVHWEPVGLPATGASRLVAGRAFRLFERGVRGVQSRLRLPFLRLINSYRFSRYCLAAFSDAAGGYDVLYERFWLLASGGRMAAQALGAPIVYEVNGDLVEEYAQLGIALSRPQWAAVNAVTRWMFAGAGRVVTVSETLRQRTIARWKIDPRQVTAVENGAQVDLFAAPAAPDELGRLRRRYGLEGRPAVVMFVGSFKPWHGLDLLVDAFARASAARPHARLVFVGDGPQRPALEAQAHSLGLDGRVVFTGAVPHPEVAALLELAQVAVLNPKVSPASRSQSPLKLFEYMAAGKAIVAPAIAPVERLLTERPSGRVNARLVSPDDAGALAEALGELLDDPARCQELGQAARRLALERHSWDGAVARIEEIFLHAQETRSTIHDNQSQRHYSRL